MHQSPTVCPSTSRFVIPNGKAMRNLLFAGTIHAAIEQQVPRRYRSSE
jgi:hypothetical protein